MQTDIPALDYTRKIETYEELFRLLSQHYADGHSMNKDVLNLLDRIDGGQRGDRGRVKLVPK